MWDQRNTKLYHKNYTGVSIKRRKTVWHELKLHLKIGIHTVRTKDRKMICEDVKVLKK